jgi:serine/threonine protein kinase
VDEPRPDDDAFVESSPSGLVAGQILDGRYRLVRPLGEGGMGLVWEAEQLALRRKVAVKSLRYAGADLHDRLRREALALASVHHPAVVQVYDYGETREGVPYVVMELVSGESLAARLARLGAMPAEEAVALSIPLLDGLAAAHQAGIIHRDIKPSNVLLAQSPSGAQPKLLDFGIALVERAGAPRLTREGGLLGTPTYMAPEQIRGQKTDERSDVWGVATLIYELIAGEPPFPSDDLVTVLRQVVDQPPPYPRSARGMNGRLWSILMGALRKSPSERTPSVLALRDALAAWLESRGAPLPASAISGPSRSREGHAATLPAALLPSAQAAPAALPGGPPAPPLPAAPPRAGEGAAPSLDELIKKKLGES